MHVTGKRNTYGFAIIFMLIFCNMFVSCVSLRKAKYFNDVPDSIASSVVISQPTPFVDPKIESNDILAITVQTVTQNETNTPITTNSPGIFNEINGNLVDKDGYIELELIGFVKVAGLTTSEARELIKQKATKYYNNPVVNVRIANFDILVLGEVGHAGKITSPSEKINIMDAIAMSGDLPLTARRDNIMLIRSYGDRKEIVRLNLNSSSIYRSPYYWLKQRDQIYVEPTKFRVQSSDNTFVRNLGIVSSLLSIVSIALILRTVK